MALAGVSTLGITYGWGVESTAGEKPTTFKQLTRIASIGGIEITNETIDASTLEDYVSRNIRGRSSTSETQDITVNDTPDTRKEWNEVIEAYKALTGGKRMWFQQIIDGFEDADFTVAQPPAMIPSSAKEGNSLLQFTIPLVVEEYKGMSAKVPFTNATSILED